MQEALGIFLYTTVASPKYLSTAELALYTYIEASISVER